MTPFELLFLAFTALMALLAGAAVAFLQYAERIDARAIIEREMSTAPPEPVHPDLLDEIVRAGGYDVGRDRLPVTEGEMDAVRRVIERVRR